MPARLHFLAQLMLLRSPKIFPLPTQHKQSSLLDSGYRRLFVLLYRLNKALDIFQIPQSKLQAKSRFTPQKNEASAYLGAGTPSYFSKNVRQDAD